MSSEEKVNDCKEPGDSELLFLARHLKDYPSAIAKSQLPEAKKKKDAALQTIIWHYASNYGKAIDQKCLLKKINNMKTRLRKKRGLKQTGTRNSINLNSWEKVLCEVMEGDCNPTCQGTPDKGATSAGFPINKDEPALSSNRLDKSAASALITPLVCLSPVPSESTVQEESRSDKPWSSIRSKNVSLRPETDETCTLTNAELQRLVLLEQIETARAQRDAAEALIEFCANKAAH